ncbi:MAG: cysteine--tRNA ligase [Candidatus Thorarchaeota archaeon]
MKIYNTMSRKIEPLVVADNTIKIYCCGPTVYALPHIGNFRTFFFADTLRRWLKYRNYNTMFVMNITDIDDKTIRDSKKEKLSLKEFTEKYTLEFFRGLTWLNIEFADVHPKATEHIPEMLELVQKLLNNDLAYEKDGSVYFSIDKFPDYGRLAQLKKESLAIGKSVDVDEYDKDNPADFVLWKKSKQDEIDRGIFWESKWGKGRPGWHLECSILSTKYLGESFDIHLGGVDLIFPHHTNEIAQSEGANESDSSKPFVKYWMHGAHLIVDGKKMSKSAGNYFTLDDLIEKNDSNSVRMYFLNTHYRDVLNFTFDALKQIDSQRERIGTTLADLHSELSKKNLSSTSKFGESERILIESLFTYKAEIVAAMENDLDTPLVMKTLNQIIKAINTYLQDSRSDLNYSSIMLAYTILRELLDAFGLFPEKSGGLDAEIGENVIQAVITLRNEFRKQKQWETADKLRDALKNVGIELKDLAEGTRWKKI